jgi:hypothetical protein
VVSGLARALLAVCLLGRATHPIHTTATEVVQEADGRMVRIEVRLFPDDLAAAIGAAWETPDADSLIRAYVSSHLTLSDRGGAPLSLQWIAADRLGDVVRAHLRTIVPGGLAGTKIRNRLLCDRFPGQVNVVRATYDGRSATLLFTPGDPAKPLP